MVKIGTEGNPDFKPPVPYIISFSETGLMHIGWSDRMKPPADFQIIPPTLVAIELE